MLTSALRQIHLKPNLIVLASAALFLLTMTVAKIHGFSLPMWHDFIDQTPQTEVLAGKSRGVRSDDWVVTLPMAFSQAVHDPAFPVENPLIGSGQNMLLPGRIPAGSWQILLKPDTIGFIAGTDYGLAWGWWFPVLCLFLAAYLFAMRMTKGRVWFSISAGAALIFSPFFQFWSFNTALAFASSLFCLVIFFNLVKSDKLSHSLSLGCLLGYIGSVFIMTGYPPVQIGLGHFVLITGIVIYFWAWPDLKKTKRIRYLSMGLALAILLTGLLVGNTLRDAIPTITAMTSTVYPGHRVESGGSIPFARVFSNLVFASKNVGNWDVLGNVCEAASFMYLFPLTGFIVISRWRRLYDRNQRIAAAGMGIGILVTLCWMVIGFPTWIAHWSLFESLPANRAHASLGMFDWSLSVLVLGGTSAIAGSEPKSNSRSLYRGAGLAVLFTILLVAGFELNAIAHVAPMRMVSLGAGWLIVGYLALCNRPQAMALAAAIAISVTGHFNPIVRGGSSYLLENPLALMMKTVSKKYPEEKWVVVRDDEVLGNYPRLIGLPGLNGAHFAPQMTLWSAFDPTGQQRMSYNRYARIVVDTVSGSQVTFSVPKPDSFILRTDPAHDGFKRVNARLFLVALPAAEFSTPDFELVGEAAGKAAYRLK